MKKAIVLLLLIGLCVGCLFAGGAKEEKKNTSVLVFVTGVTAGSPSYELMVEGAQDFASTKTDVSIKVYEANFNQALWESQLTDLVATGNYDIVVASNPAMPEICLEVAKKFPKQKFILTDAYLEGNSQIATVLFNQYEQSLFLGYLAGLVTKSELPYANEQKTIGFITAQEYPLLNNHVLTGYTDGAHYVDPQIKVDFRVIGNWYDATKCAELTQSMLSNGVDVFAVIAGGADTGLFSTLKQKGAYVVYHNTNIYEKEPQSVIGCGLMGQRELVKELLEKAYNNELEYGKAEVVGLKEGYVSFVDNPNLPKEISEPFYAFLNNLKEGKISYTLPSLT